MTTSKPSYLSRLKLTFRMLFTREFWKSSGKQIGDCWDNVAIAWLDIPDAISFLCCWICAIFVLLFNVILIIMFPLWALRALIMFPFLKVNWAKAEDLLNKDNKPKIQENESQTS